MEKRYVGIVTNQKKEKYPDLMEDIVGYLKENNIEVFLEEPLKNPEKDKFKIVENGDIEKVEFIIIMGGDGTILKALSQIAKYNKPILGINLGKVGFLANVEKENWKEYVSKALNNDYNLDYRMMFDIFDIDNEKIGSALNDTVLTRKNYYGVCEYNVYINDELIAEYLADGVIIAAPTGSTAYNLSSGGPIVNPNCELFIVNPISPHTLNNTTIIVNSTDIIRVKFNPKTTGIYIDGTEKTPEKNEVIIKLSDIKVPFIRFSDYNFYSLLVNKIKNPIVKES